MEKQTSLLAAIGLAVVLAIFVAIRISSEGRDFDQTVRRALKTSAGYDKSFLDVVNRLETELAGRASFGYQGGKDPMTGGLRRVAPLPRTASGRAAPASAAMLEVPAPATAQAPDQVKLTAIIFDDKAKRYTAVVMDGERSYSLEVGDRIRGRVIRKITDDILYMESDSLYYKYDIFGNRSTKRK